MSLSRRRVPCGAGEHQEPRIHKQRGFDEIPIDRVAACASSGLDLQSHAVFGLEPVNLVCLGLLALLTEQNRAADLLGLLLSGFDLEAQRNQRRTEDSQGGVTRAPHRRGIEIGSRSSERGDDGRYPLGRSRTGRVVLPERVVVGHPESILHRMPVVHGGHGRKSDTAIEIGALR
jgi:hypothetical protein